MYQNVPPHPGGESGNQEDTVPFQYGEGVATQKPVEPHKVSTLGAGVFKPLVIPGSHDHHHVISQQRQQHMDYSQRPANQFHELHNNDVTDGNFSAQNNRASFYQDFLMSYPTSHQHTEQASPTATSFVGYRAPGQYQGAAMAHEPPPNHPAPRNKQLMAVAGPLVPYEPEGRSSSAHTPSSMAHASYDSSSVGTSGYQEQINTGSWPVGGAVQEPRNQVFQPQDLTARDRNYENVNFGNSTEDPNDDDQQCNYDMMIDNLTRLIREDKRRGQDNSSFEERRSAMFTQIKKETTLAMINFHLARVSEEAYYKMRMERVIPFALIEQTKVFRTYWRHVEKNLPGHIKVDKYSVSKRPQSRLSRADDEVIRAYQYRDPSARTTRFANRQIQYQLELDDYKKHSFCISDAEDAVNELLSAKIKGRPTRDLRHKLLVTFNLDPSTLVPGKHPCKPAAFTVALKAGLSFRAVIKPGLLRSASERQRKVQEEETLNSYLQIQNLDIVNGAWAVRCDRCQEPFRLPRDSLRLPRLCALAGFVQTEHLKACRGNNIEVKGDTNERVTNKDSL